jgi:hypothetical protein
MDLDFNQYCNFLESSLETYLGSYVDSDVLDYLNLNFLFYSYYTENLSLKITKNHSFFPANGVFQNFFGDNLRALIPLYSNLNLSPLAFIDRALLEARINANFIYQDPKERFKKYYRFSEVEKYLHNQDQINPLLSTSEVELIRKENPEWFVLKNNGKYKIIKNWTGDEKLNLWEMAVATNLENEFRNVYKLTSVYVHCSPVVNNAYITGPDSSHPIPITLNREILAISTSRYGIEFLKDMYGFFGIEFPSKHYHEEVDSKFFKLMKKYKFTDPDGKPTWPSKNKFKKNL